MPRSLDNNALKQDFALNLREILNFGKAYVVVVSHVCTKFRFGSPTSLKGIAWKMVPEVIFARLIFLCCQITLHENSNILRGNC